MLRGDLAQGSRGPIDIQKGALNFLKGAAPSQDIMAVLVVSRGGLKVKGLNGRRFCRDGTSLFRCRSRLLPNQRLASGTEETGHFRRNMSRDLELCLALAVTFWFFGQQGLEINIEINLT